MQSGIGVTPQDLTGLMPQPVLSPITDDSSDFYSRYTFSFFQPIHLPLSPLIFNIFTIRSVSLIAIKESGIAII